MTEKLLQFIWKQRYFNQQGLELLTGERLTIEYPGDDNVHQGPDFLNARIRINDNQWMGSVELHLFSSGWMKHSHTEDENYRNVILHVVWKQDHLVLNREIPQLELSTRVPHSMLDIYAGWMNKPLFIPCELAAAGTERKKWVNWASRLLINRLNRKSDLILDSLQKNHFHWEEQLWWMIANNFGVPVNASAFESIARSIPFSLLAKHRKQFIQLEALLIGQANLLDRHFTDPYALLLKREFQFLKKKYNLKKNYESVHFLRMRPESFPAIRLSQLASLYAENTSLFAWTLECDSVALLKRKMMVCANDYWSNHYVFEKTSGFRLKWLGTIKCESIIINSVIPLLYAYGKFIPDQDILDRSIAWLKQIPPEQNHIMDGWKHIGISMKKAAGSQALMELKKQFCDQRKCLECEIGKDLLRPDSDTGPS